MVKFIFEDLCVGCTLCVKVCPVDVLRMEERPSRPQPKANGFTFSSNDVATQPGPGQKEPSVTDQVAVIAYGQDCQTCFLCEIYCPVSAIYVDPKRGALHGIWPA